VALTPTGKKPVLNTISLRGYDLCHQFLSCTYALFPNYMVDHEINSQEQHKFHSACPHVQDYANQLAEVYPMCYNLFDSTNDVVSW
jgi:hypothetical protein